MISTPTRLLFITNSGDLGGASLDLLGVLDGLSPQQFQPLVVVSEDGALLEHLAARQVETAIRYQPWWTTPGTEDAWLYSMRRLPAAVCSLRELIRKEHIELVYTNTSVTPAGALAAAVEGKPHVWRAQEFIGQGGFRGPLNAEIIHGSMLALSAAVLPNSPSLAKRFFEAGGGGNVRVVYSGIECERFAACKPDRHNQAILTIGTMTPHKGLDDLVEAAALLAKRGIEFSVTVVGGFDHESYKAGVVRKIRSFGLAARFEFVGYQEDIRPWLNRASVYCCPSHTEGMSRVIVEAMAAGLPVVSTDCGGPRDLVQAGQTGRLVPVGQPEALAAALAEVLADSKAAAAQGQAGRQLACRLFDIRQTTEQVVEVLAEAARCGPAVEAAPVCDLLLKVLEVAGPRILLGKKWRLLKPLMSRIQHGS